MSTQYDGRRLGCRLCVLLDGGLDSGSSYKKQEMALQRVCRDASIQHITVTQSWRVKLQDAPSVGELTEATETRMHAHRELKALTHQAPPLQVKARLIPKQRLCGVLRLLDVAGLYAT